MTDHPSSSLSPVDDPSRGLRRFVYLLVIAVAAGGGLASIMTASVLYSPGKAWPKKRPPYTPMFSANDRSRWCTVWSLAERGTYEIDEIIQKPGWNTIDKGQYRDHFYSSKPPFLSTIVAGLYCALKRAVGLDLLTDTHATVRTILVVINWLPWMIALALLAAIAERYAQTDFSRVFLMIAAAGGTFLTTFLTTFNNHTIAATSVVFAIYPTLRVLNDGRRGAWLFALAGFWGAFAACSEIPAALFGLILFAALVYKAPGRTLAWFVPAAIVPLAFFFYTNWLSTGGLMPFYANFGKPGDTFYKYIYNGVPSYWTNPSPIDVGESSPWIYLFHCTLGHHGIFSLSPIFLITIVGWARLVRRFPLRFVGCLSLVLTVWVLGFYLWRTQNYNYGGNTSGLRWAFWLIPLWLLAMVPALDAWGSRRWFQGLCGLLLAISAFSAAFPHVNPWQSPWIQQYLIEVAPKPEHR